MEICLKDESIKQAVEVLTEKHNKQDDWLKKSTYGEHIQALLDLGRCYLSITGLPAKKEVIKDATDWAVENPRKAVIEDKEAKGFNNALDACRLAITKKIDEIRDIVLDDVPHQYQKRLLDILNSSV